MFRTVFPSIIRSWKLQILQQAYVKHLPLPAASGYEVELMELNFIPTNSSCVTHARCSMCSFELLMMDRKTVRNM